MKYKILVLMTVVGLIFSLFGCQQNNAIIKPDVDMKTVTQNSLDDYVTFTFELPSDWNISATGYTSLGCIFEENNVQEKMSPYMLSIESYINPALPPIDDTHKKIYTDLFNGQHGGIEEIITDSIEYINIEKVMDSFPHHDFTSPENLLEYFNILADGPSTPDITISESWDDKVWANNFSYSEYNGKNGKIIAVEYYYVIVDKTYKAINCYRDDNYLVCGVFDNEKEFSSGDLALWVANTMEVAEHYKFEDNVLKKEGVDY